METITIPKAEYLDLLDLYQKIKIKFDIITEQAVKKGIKKIDALKYCGTITINKDALQIQKEMRDEWE